MQAPQHPPAVDPSTPPPPSAEEVRAQLERVLLSKPFASSDRLKRFLRFVVVETLAGRHDQLKEYAIGTHVYDRGETFDPRADAIVRTEASRLRARLEEYSRDAGRQDAIHIALPKGGYVPAFRRLTPPASETPPAGSEPNPQAARRPSPDSVATTGRGRRSRRTWWAAACAAALLSIGGVWAFISYVTRQPDFRERDWLLIGSFDNRTGDPLLDGTLELAIEAELSRSRFVNVVPRPRVEDTLRLMRQSPDTPLTTPLAQEVAVRDGAIPVLLAGTIAKTGERYSVTLRLTESARGRSLGVHDVQVHTPDDLLPAARDLARWIRQRLGEAGMAESAEPLDRVTTSSLEALRFFSHGMRAINERQWDKAEALLKLAVAEDPEFASAHIYLSHTLRDVGKVDAEWRGYVARARELVPHVSERERLFILGSVHSMEGDHARAAGFYEALLRQYPDDFWATNNLLVEMAALHPTRRDQYLTRQAELRPHDLDTNLAAAWMIARRDGHLANAGPFISAVKRAGEARDADYHVDLFSAFDAWLRTDLAAVRDTYRRLAAHPRPQDLSYVTHVALPSLGLGLLGFAEAALLTLSDQVVVHRWMPWVAEARGDAELFERYARGLAGTRPSALSVIALVRSGHLASARRMLDDEGKAKLPHVEPRRVQGFWKVAEGELALSTNRLHEAVKLLEDGRRLIQGLDLPSPPLHPTPVSDPFIAAESLARILVHRGKAQQAREVLRAAVADRVSAFGTPMYFWARCAKRLADLERRLGNTEAADALEAQLSVLLANADPDFRLDLDWTPVPGYPAVGPPGSAPPAGR